MNNNEVLEPYLKELWENIDLLIRLGFAIEYRNELTFEFTSKDLIEVEGLNKKLKAQLKLNRKPKGNLGFFEIYEIDMLHDGLIEIFKLKKGNLVFSFEERFQKIKALYEDYLPWESPYPDSVYKKLAITPKELRQIAISDKVQLDSPSKFADYAQSKKYHVSSKTIERHRIRYQKRKLSLLMAFRMGFSIQPFRKHKLQIDQLIRRTIKYKPFGN